MQADYPEAAGCVNFRNLHVDGFASGTGAVVARQSSTDRVFRSSSRFLIADLVRLRAAASEI